MKGITTGLYKEMCLFGHTYNFPLKDGKLIRSTNNKRCVCGRRTYNQAAHKFIIEVAENKLTVVTQ